MTAIPAPMTFVMLAIFTTMVGIATTYPPGARFMVFVVGIPAIGLCLLQLAIDLARRRVPSAEENALQDAEDQVSRIAGRRVHFEMPSDSGLLPETVLEPRERLRREIVAWSYFIGLIGGILLFGFRITVPLFLVAFLRFQARTGWRAALLYGVGGAMAMYLLFEKLLRVSLHTGFITEFVLDRISS